MVVLSNTNLEQARSFCDKVAREIKGNEIIEIMPFPEFCFSISAGVVEAAYDSNIEHLLADAESKQDTFYEFRVC